MSDLVAHVRKQMIKSMVMRHIFCPRTGEVFDVRTCVVIADSDGDPAYVVSQAGWADIVAEGNDVTLAAQGFTPDPTTVKEN